MLILILVYNNQWNLGRKLNNTIADKIYQSQGSIMLCKVGGIYIQNHSLDEGQQSTTEKILILDKMVQYGSSNDYFKLVN